MDPFRPHLITPPPPAQTRAGVADAVPRPVGPPAASVADGATLGVVGVVSFGVVVVVVVVAASVAADSVAAADDDDGGGDDDDADGGGHAHRPIATPRRRRRRQNEAPPQSAAAAAARLVGRVAAARPRQPLRVQNETVNQRRQQTKKKAKPIVIVPKKNAQQKHTCDTSTGTFQWVGVG